MILLCAAHKAEYEAAIHFFPDSGEGKFLPCWTDTHPENIGKRIEAALISHPGIAGILDTGCCGSLSDCLPLSTLCHVTTVLDGDDLAASEQTDLIIPLTIAFKDAVLVSVRQPLLRKNPEFLEYREVGAEICSMETLSLQRLSRQWGLPFASLRVVTDLCDLPFSRSYIRQAWSRLTELYRELKSAVNPDGHLSGN